MGDYFANRYFAPRYFPTRYYQGVGGVVVPPGSYVVRYQGVSKATMSGISILAFELTPAGEGTYDIKYSSTVSDNKTDSASYEGVEVL